MEAMVAGSAEYFQTRGGGTTDGFLDALYADALGRGLDSTGRADWDQALASGVSPAEVATAIFASTEFLQDVVQGFYQSFLHRPADATGLGVWVSALQRGMSDDQVIAGIVGSAEYFDRL
jgi:hypothetical protein